MDFQKVKNRVRKNIWVICAQNNPEGLHFLSGVAISRNRILSCAHGITNSISFIMGRMLHESGFKHKLRTVYVRPNSELRILECVNGTPVGFEWGTISVDERLSMSEQVFAMGNPCPYPGSFVVGKVSYRCKEITDLSFLSDSRICSEYYHDRKQTLDYRYAGEVLNKDTINGMPKIWSIQHPMLPLIQCANLNIASGFSGGPLYKLNGDIIGILISSGNYDEAVHISAVKALIAEVETNVARGMRYPESTTFDASEWLEMAPT